MTIDRDAISKSLEEGRAARRERARAKVAGGWVPPKPEPRSPARRRGPTAAEAHAQLAARTKLVDDLLVEAELVSQQLADEGDVHHDDAYHDVAQALSMTIPHVADRKDFLRRAGVLPCPSDPDLVGWDWLDDHV